MASQTYGLWTSSSSCSMCGSCSTVPRHRLAMPTMVRGLNKIDQALTEVVPAVIWRQDSLAIKTIQAPKSST